MNRKKPSYRAFILLLAIALLGGCSLFGDEKDKTKGWSADKFYSKASKAMADGDYTSAIKYYELLEARYPFGPQARQAQLDVAYAYYKSGDPDSAIAAADRFIQLNPDNPHAAYAYYLKGIANFNRTLGFLERFMPTDTSQRDPRASLASFKDFSELVRKYPDSEYAEDATKRLLYLRNNLARHEIHVANYYMRRGAYVAAAERGDYVVKHYQKTPAVRDALTIMATAYDRLGLTDLADDARRVLALNAKSGALINDANASGGKSWGQRIWNFLGLDR